VGTDDEMTPRVQLGNVPWAVQALTVPDGSITTEKIADGAVTVQKLDLRGRVGIGTSEPGSQLEIEDFTSEHLAIILENADSRGGVEFESQSATSFGEGILNLGIGTGRGIPPKGDESHAAWFRVDTRARERNFSWFWRAPNGGEVRLMRLSSRGDLWVLGAKSALVQAGSFGPRKLYAAESPEVRFFDEGLARLQGGVARVELDPIFVETIEGDYLVHVTPYGDASLYVAEVGKDYFVVKVREGDPNVAFAWRLSAIRKGYAGVRLEEVR